MTSWAALAIAASLVARGVRWPDQRLIAIDADPELLGQRHCSRWFRGLVTIPGGEYIYSASTQRLSIRMYILYDSYGSPKVRRALPTVRGTNTANTLGTQARPPHPPSLLRLGNLRRCGAIPPIRAHSCTPTRAICLCFARPPCGIPSTHITDSQSHSPHCVSRLVTLDWSQSHDWSLPCHRDRPAVVAEADAEWGLSWALLIALHQF